VTTAAHRNAERTRQMSAQRVWATPAAVDAIIHLRAQLGNLVLRHVAGDSGAPEVRLVSTRTPCGPDDIAVGTVGGVLFLIDRDHDIALGCPDFHVDVTPTQLDNDDAGIRAQYHLISRAVQRD
jgi:hypothetical protein